MNSVVQCLKRMNELNGSLKEFTEQAQTNQQGDPHALLTYAGGQMMKDLETKSFSYPPFQFVDALRRAYPIFDERD